MTTDTAERTDVTNPETTAQPDASTKTEDIEEVSTSGGTEREGVVQTGEAEGTPETKPQLTSEELARKVEIDTAAAELVDKQTAENTRKEEQRLRVLETEQAEKRAKEWLTDPRAKAFNKGREMKNEFGDRKFSDQDLTELLSSFDPTNLTLVEDLRVVVNRPIEYGAKDLILERGGQAVLDEWLKNDGKLGAKDYLASIVDAVAPKTLDEYLKAHPKDRTRIDKEKADFGLVEFQRGVDAPAGSGSSEKRLSSSSTRMTLAQIDAEPTATWLARPKAERERLLSDARAG